MLSTMLRRTTLFASVLLAAGLGCSGEHDHEHEHHPGEHKAAHGGCLNALGTCENGPVDAKLDGAPLDVWCVGGGSSTDQAVRIPDAEISLSVLKKGDTEARSLTLKACPNELAEEKTGDCSHFRGQADWLKGLTGFTATGEVTFKGTKQALRIEYPDGHHPDHEHHEGK